jgi:predicted Zn finger-like uncharacterized protein
MSDTMNCPGCQTLLRVREEMAGKKIKCPRCAHVVAIPAKGVEVVETLEEVREPEARVTAEPKAKGKAAATRPCPECGERIPVEARKCRYCKAAVAEDEVEEVDEDEEEDEEEEHARKRSKYKPCPRCGEVGAKRVVWTPWGSFYGPAMFTHVRCPECGYAYNGRSGRSNLIPAIIFVSLPLLFILAIFGVVIWYIHHLGYF